jgi:hypothetical protein
MTKTTTIEIWALIDERGDYVVSPLRRSLGDQWADEIGDPPLNARVIRLSVVVELPRGAEGSAVGVIARPAPADGEVSTHVRMEI